MRLTRSRRRSSGHSAVAVPTLGAYDARQGHLGTATVSTPEAGALNPPARGAADLGSLARFVLEGELKLGAIGDRPALV